MNNTEIVKESRGGLNQSYSSIKNASATNRSRSSSNAFGPRDKSNERLNNDWIPTEAVRVI
jgi:hypothetical protein